jgi:hypothetical protein
MPADQHYECQCASNEVGVVVKLLHDGGGMKQPKDLECCRLKAKVSDDPRVDCPIDSIHEVP